MINNRNNNHHIETHDDDEHSFKYNDAVCICV
jgi:hypothetical protein